MCVCLCAWWDIYLLLTLCFFTRGLKFGLITTWDGEGELGFSPGAGAATSIWELSLLPISSLPNSQGAGNHFQGAVFLGSLPTVNKWVGFDGAAAVFWFPGRRGPSAAFLPLPGLPWNWLGGVGWTRSDPSSAGTEATRSLQWPPSLPTNTKFIAGLRGEKKVSTSASFQNREKQ